MSAFKTTNELIQARDTFIKIVEVLDEAVAIAEREERGEVISEDESNAVIGKLVTAYLALGDQANIV